MTSNNQLNNDDKKNKITSKKDDYFKLNSSVNNIRSSLADIKFIIHSIVPDEKKKKLKKIQQKQQEIIDSSITDQSLEFKPIIRGKSECDVKNINSKTKINFFTRKKTKSCTNLIFNEKQNKTIKILETNEIGLDSSGGEFVKQILKKIKHSDVREKKLEKIFIIGDDDDADADDEPTRTTTATDTFTLPTMLESKEEEDFLNIEILSSSTPMKMVNTKNDLHLNIDVIKNYEYKLNLLTPPADAIFIDSDFESMEQDQYDDSTGSSKESLTDEIEIKKLTEKIDDTTIVHVITKNVTELNDLSDVGNCSIPNNLNKELERPKSRSRNPLSIFSLRKKKYRSGDEMRKDNFRRSLSVDGRRLPLKDLICIPLTKENIEMFVEIPNKTLVNIDEKQKPLEWGDDFEFSFFCEPSTSDIEEEEEEEVEDKEKENDNGIFTKYESTNTSSPDSSFELRKNQIIPVFKIDPPPLPLSLPPLTLPCEMVRNIVTNTLEIKTATTSILRRSISDPNCLLEPYSSSAQTTDGESDNEFQPALEYALKPAINLINCAAVKNLETISSRALTSGTSPFRRWGQSSLRSRSGEIRQPLTRRPSSLAASDNDVYTKSIDDQVTGERHHDQIIDQTLNYGPTSWSTSFEKLLNDSAGLHTFAEFLKKEFSAENIYFWTACERYIQLDNNERKKQAEEIFSKHLAIGAPEPVNVDSHARTTTQENLQNAEKNLFLSPQKQIFNLMKFDSYARFIRSDLYKSCVDAANKNQPAPYPGEQLDALLRTGLTVATPIKLKKSLSNADDRRRKSLLPWHRKTRCKSKDRDDFCSLKENTIKTVTATTTGTASIGSTGSALKISNSGSDIHSSRSSLSSFDAVISSRSTNIDSEDNRSSLCRVLLSDGATTIVQTKNSESIRDLVERLLEKRGICYQAYEAFLSGNNKPMDLENPSVSLAGKEVQIEQRVIFKLDLPNRKVISVKSKPCKALGEVLRPILHKYNFKLDLVQVFSRESTEPLDMTLPVTVTDGQRLQVLCKPIENLLGEITQITTATTLSTIQKVQKTNIGPNGQIIMNQPTVSVPTINQNGNSPPAGTSSTLFLGKNETVQHRMGTNNLTNKPIQQSTLDEITNKVFNELLQGKVESHSAQCLVPPQQRASDQGSIRSEDWGSETSSGIFGRLRRRDSNNPGSRMNKIKKLGMPSKSSTAGSEDGIDAVNANIKKPLIAKWKAGVKLQVTGRSENHDLLEGLKRAQRSRLEDQRGTEINFELPDFLKDKENLNNNKFRKLKRHPNDINPSSSNEPVPLARSILEDSTPSNLSVSVRPQPAPRLSINSKNNNQFSSVQSKINELENSFGPSEYSNSSLNLSTRCLMSPTRDLNSSNLRQYSPRSENSADTTLVFNHHEQDDKNNDSMNSDNQMDSSFSSIGTMNNYNYNDDGTDIDGINHKGPPPLPPKPKILPIKPSNWGQNNNNISSSTSSSCGSGKLQNDDIFKVPQELPRRLINEKQRNVYLDQPSSSFV